MGLVDGFMYKERKFSLDKNNNTRAEVREIDMSSITTATADEETPGPSETKKFWHLLFEGWPDFLVPEGENRSALLNLIRLSRQKNSDNTTNPRIVHCSAGVGRSGTFIALENLIRDLDSGELEHYDRTHGGETAEAPDLVFDTVNALREQRKMMVQSESQFLFIYQVMRKLWIERYGTPSENGEPAAKRLGLDLDPFIESRDSE